MKEERNVLSSFGRYKNYTISSAREYWESVELKLTGWGTGAL